MFIANLYIFNISLANSFIITLYLNLKRKCTDALKKANVENVGKAFTRNYCQIWRPS